MSALSHEPKITGASKHQIAGKLPAWIRCHMRPESTLSGHSKLRPWTPQLGG